MTSYLPEQWSRRNPARGQCAVTALLVHDFFGGTILVGTVRGEEHYWNLLDDDVEYDLTLNQFGPDASYEGPPEEASREEILDFGDTNERYRLLLERVRSATLIVNFLEVEERIAAAE